MEEETKTQEEILKTIKAARDSVSVINETAADLDAGATPTLDRKGNLDRNVGHLNVVVARQYIIDSGEDISDLNAAITLGESKLAEHTWPVSEEN